MVQMDTLRSVTELVVTALLVLRMIVSGFLQPPGGVFSWPMFTRGCQIDADLQVRTPDGVQQVDMFTVLPSHHPAVSSVEMQLLVDHLARTRGPVSGSGVAYHAGGTEPVTIRNSRVDI